MPVARLLDHLKLRRPEIDGVSIAGGEPTEQAEAVAALLAGAQSLGLSTVVFSGHTLAHLRRDPACEALLAHTDLLIDGPFIAAQADTDLYWRGSRNQNLIRLTDRFRETDLAAPRANGEILLTSERISLVGVGIQASLAGRLDIP